MDDLIRVPFTEIRYNKISEPCSGTGKWFLDLEVFTSWRDGSQNSLLWINGSPGQGKSVLAKLVTKHLEHWVSGEKCTVIYFFCYNQEESFSHASDILRALIIQLIDCQEQFKHLPTEFAKDSKGFFKAPLAQLWELFQKLVLQKLELSNKSQRIYCVVDALDECIQDNGQRSDLLRGFVELLAKEQRLIKILITSRPSEKDIKEQLERLPSWSLQADPEDLKKFINSKIERLPVCTYNDLLKTKVLDSLHKQAGRTFLWVSIVVKEIADLEAPSLHEIESLLAENPKPLNQLYGRLLSRIAATDTATKTFSKLLIWVAYSEQPLTVRELEDAITYDPSIERYKSLSEMERHRRPWQLVFKKLRTLLEVEKKFDRIRREDQHYIYFNHQSVRDYFHNNRDEALKNLKFDAGGGPDPYLARTCIWYLNAKEFYETSFESLAEHQTLLDRYHFLGYSSSQWYEYVKTIEIANSEWEQIQHLLDYRRPLLKVWGGPRVAGISHNPWRNRMGYPVSNLLTLLVIVFDISWLAELIVTGQIEAEHFEGSEVRDMAYFAPKSFQRLLCLPEMKILITKEMVEQVARSRGAIVSMQLLLDHQAQEIEITESMIANAASNYGEGEGLLQLLFNQEAAAGIRITEGILKSAAKNLNEGVMRLILKRRSKEIKITEAVLEAATRSRRGGAMMRLLLEQRGEEIQITETIVVAATGSSHGPAVLKLLLEERGSDVLITENIVRAATGSSHGPAALKLLLEERGQDVKITQRVLLAAAEGEISTLQLLLERRGSEVLITEDIIVAAANHYDPDILKLLLEEEGADVKAAHNVLLAAAKGSESTLQLLLEHRGSEVLSTEKLVEAAEKSNGDLDDLENLSLKSGDELVAEVERQVWKWWQRNEISEKRLRARANLSELRQG